MAVAIYWCLGCLIEFYVFSLYHNPDLDGRIHECLLTSMAAVQAEDVIASFLFMADLSGHQELLGSIPRSVMVLRPSILQLIAHQLDRYLLHLHDHSPICISVQPISSPLPPIPQPSPAQHDAAPLLHRPSYHDHAAVSDLQTTSSSLQLTPFRPNLHNHVMFNNQLSAFSPYQHAAASPQHVAVIPIRLSPIHIAPKTPQST